MALYPIPEGSGDFSTLAFTFDTGPSVECGSTVFVGQGSSGQKGIYTNVGGTLEKVVDVDDTLGGIAVDNVFISRQALSQGRILFGVNEPGGSATSIDAIWLATSSGNNPCLASPVPALGPHAFVALAALLMGAGALVLRRPTRCG